MKICKKCDAKNPDETTLCMSCENTFEEEKDEVETVYIANGLIIMKKNASNEYYMFSEEKDIFLEECNMNLEAFIELIKSDCKKYQLKVSFELDSANAGNDGHTLVIKCRIADDYNYALIVFPYTKENIKYLMENYFSSADNDTIRMIKTFVEFSDCLDDEDKLKIMLK